MARVVLLCGVLLPGGLLWAQGSVKQMELRNIMDRMGSDMEAIVRATTLEDWNRVASLASAIANHAEPPMTEKLRILAWLGSDAGRFRQHDARLKEVAGHMQQAAEAHQGADVIRLFAKTQQSCLECHQSFRQPFVERFHEGH